MNGISPKSPKLAQMGQSLFCTTEIVLLKRNTSEGPNGDWQRATTNGIALSNKIPQLHVSSVHEVKGFTNDIMIISSSVKDHSAVLQDISKGCSDLHLALKPSKCVFLVEFDKQATFLVCLGRTRNTSSGQTKFLGHLVDIQDSASLRGEYKLRISRLFFSLCTMNLETFLSTMYWQWILFPGLLLRRWKHLPPKISRDGSAYLDVSQLLFSITSM